MKEAVKAIGSLLKKKLALWLGGLFGFSGVLIVLIVIMLIIIIIGALGGSVDQQLNSNNGTGFYSCSPTEEVNTEKWDDILTTPERSGKLNEYGDTIIELSEEEGIDPVLFAAIALHETGWGKSNAIRLYNNPGGLMSSETGELMEFPTLKDGLKSMATTLHNRIIVDGLITIEQLGSVYAPIGASNDPDGLNENWEPRVTEITEQLGGLTMNCDLMEDIEVDLIGDYAWVAPYTKRISSGYGWRGCAGCSSFHKGLDIASEGIEGTPIVAFSDGKIIASESQGTTHISSSDNMGTGFGWYVLVEHEDGMKTRYAHMKSQGKPVGTNVQAGDVIGTVGSTGASTAAHLHFEIIINDNEINPLIFVKDFLVNK